MALIYDIRIRMVDNPLALVILFVAFGWVYNLMYGELLHDDVVTYHSRLLQRTIPRITTLISTFINVFVLTFAELEIFL